MNYKFNKPLATLKAFYLDRFQPQSYTEALTQLELLYSVLKYVNLIIDRVNSFQDIINEIILYINEFEKQVKDATVEVVTDLYNNGQLEEILQNVSKEYFDALTTEVRENITNMKNEISNIDTTLTTLNENYSDTAKNVKFSTSDTLNWELAFRTLVSTGRNFNHANYAPDPAGYYTNAQGSTVVNKNGINYYVISSTMEQYNIPNTVNAYSNNIRIRKYVDGNITSIQSLTLNNFGHANGMCYNPDDNCLYLVSGAHYVGSTLTFDFNVAKIDFDSLNLIEVKDFAGASGLPANIDHFTSCNYFNGSVYLNSRKFCCKLVDWDSPTVENVFTANDNIIESYIGTTAQVSFYAGDFILWLTHAPSNLYVMKKNGDLLFKYDIATISEGWNLGEVEDIDFNYETGEFYICHSFNICSSDYAQLRHNGFIRGNLFTNFTKNGYNPFLTMPSRLDVIYVNQVSTIQNGTTTKPNGSQSAPFYCTQEAFNYANNNPDIEMIDIKLQSDDTRMLYGIALKSFYINGAIPNIENSGTTPTTCYRLGGAIVRGNGGFSSVTLVSYNTLQVAQHHAVLKILHGSFSCNYTFVAPWLGASTTPNATEYFTHGISMTAAFLNYYGGYTKEQVEGQSGDNKNYTLITQALSTNSTANMHGFSDVTGTTIA